ncbi:hypothetical protein [Paenibacillus sp. MMO-177]|uniref:hypothetical protein n=1 Tax=Paenibacillus sp. MMO-177 TaxID=3081289 RepID=UPI00301667D5
MSNDNYDLFTYFGDSSSFSTGTTSDKAEPAPVSPSVVTESTSEDPNGKETNVVSFSSRRGTHIDQTSTVKDNDSCETEEPEEDDEDRDAMSDEPVEDESAANKAELAGKSSIATSNSTAKGKKEEEKPVFNQTTYICYSGMSLPITKYFMDDLANLTLEDVRKRLEKDFPELSKQRTKMEWDKSKNIICPMVTGGKKGLLLQPRAERFLFPLQGSCRK